MIDIKILQLDKFRVVFENILNYIFNKKDEKGDKKKEITDLWSLLLLEENHKLIKKLRHIEKKEIGWGTIVMPKEGFSKNKKTHKEVLKWLKKRKINILDVKKEIKELNEALKNEPHYKDIY